MSRVKFTVVALAALLASVPLLPAQPQAPSLSPKAHYNHKPKAGPYPRGRAAPAPHVHALMLANHPPQDFPNVTLKSYDSRADGKLTPPFRNQRKCGSCWDFSGIRTIAYARMKAGLKPFQLSEQFILDCTRNGGCGGDDNTTVLKVAKAQGIPADADYGPYTASEGRCKYTNQPLVKIPDWVFVDGDAGYDRVGDTQKIKNAIYATGAVGCAVAANSSWDGYSGGVHRGHSRQIDHDVVINGWQDDPSIPEGGWWWMDNSWSEEWGEGGRMKIAYGADSIGTEPVAVVLTQPEPPPPPPVPPAPPVPATDPRRLLVVGLLAGGTLVAVVVVFVILRSRKVD